jgi:N-hydroxyarylamine O-acetyltransferase
VLGQPVSMEPPALLAKLVAGGRGGYCFEHNTLLRLALTSLGFEAAPLLCRVRWGKAAEEITTFTHMALQVSVPGGVSVDCSPAGR